MTTNELVEKIISRSKVDGVIKADEDTELFIEAAIRLSILQRRIDNWASYEESKKPPL